MKKILITGGTGFAGRNLAEQLHGKYQICAPRHSELDLTDSAAVEKYLKKNGFDVVIHAAQFDGRRTKPPTQSVAEPNLRMFFNLARCSNHFGRMIQLGSGADYGRQTGLCLAKEEDFGKRIPQDSYGFFKYVCSKHIENSEGITCLRLFGCFGKYEDIEHRFISNAICRAILGTPIRIKNCNVVFSYLYVDDLVKITEHFIENEGRHKFYNLAPDERTDLVSIAKTIRGISGNKVEIEVANPGLGQEYTADNSRLKAELGRFKFAKMKDSIRALYRWYEKNRELIERDKQNL